MQSRTYDMGHEIGHKRIKSNQTMGESLEANRILSGPEKSAEGMISQNMRTSVTDNTTANQEGTSWSRKRGRASVQQELVRSKVQIN